MVRRKLIAREMSLLNSVYEHVIETSEQMIKVVEEAHSLVFGEDTVEEQTVGRESFGTDDNIEADVMDDWEEELENNMNAESPLKGIADGVLSDIFKDQIGPQNAWENIDAFRTAISWNEPFIIALISFHVLLLIITFAVIRYDGMKMRVSFLILLAILVRSAEMLNHYGSKNWEDFATQNYFDEGGIFVCIMVSAPIVFTSFIMLVAYLREASQLLVQVKRAEIKQKYSKKKSSKNGNKPVKKEIGKEE